MLLSIITVNWNTTSLLTELLESIRKYPPPFDHEIIVVDNASSDFDKSLFQKRFPEAELIANTYNAGYAKGNNQGIAISRGNYVLLLNPDIKVTESALKALVEFMQLHTEAGAAGAKLIKPDGTIDRSLRSFPYPAAIAWEYTGMSRIFPKSRTFGSYRMTYFDYKSVKEVDQPMGSCLIISRRAIESVGLFDEQFPIFFNEVDWLYRAKQAGFKIYYTPSAVLIHSGGASTKQVPRKIMIRESHDSLIKFYGKHFKSKIPVPLYYLIIASIRLGVYFRR